MICPFLRTFCVTRCLRQRLKGQSFPIVGLHGSSLRYNEDRQVVIRPKHLRKAKVIEIYNGMSPRDISSASGIPIDRVYETMRKYRIPRELGTLGDVKDLISRLQLRFSVVAPPDERGKEVEEIDIDKIIEKTRIPDGSDYRVRPPIVTIMGHVDHGKTTLLDALRKSEIVKAEFGGITQHIGAFVVSLDGNVSRRKQGMIPSGKVQEVVTFLDTPGHAAFAAMRQRGANVTDMVILVIAAEDGVMEQTIESIKYAQNAGVQMIVALNKIDKVPSVPEAIERVTKELYSQGIILESDGGEVQLVKISALKGEGLQDVKDAIGALAETMDLQAPYDGGVVGSVIEVKVDPHLGKLATILVQKGCLKKGDYLLAGDMSFCRVRSIQDEFGQNVDKVPPGFPALISGWKEGIPEVGERVYQFESEKPAKDIMNLAKLLVAEERGRQAIEERQAETELSRIEWEKKRVEADNEGIPDWLLRFRTRKKHQKTYTDDPSEPFKVRVLIKADVVGSAEVLSNIIQSYPNDTQLVKLIPISQSVGLLTESDVETAASFENSIIYSFNVPIPPKILNLAREKGVKIKHFNVIYHLVDDLRKAISEKIPEQDVDEEVARAVVQKQFDVNSKNKKTLIAGCRCLKGPLIKSNVFYKIIRNDQVLASGLEIDIMKHEKDEVKEIATNQECGLTFKNLPPDVSFKPLDIISCYKIKKIKPETKWRPPGF